MALSLWNDNMYKSEERPKGLFQKQIDGFWSYYKVPLLARSDLL